MHKGRVVFGAMDEVVWTSSCRASRGRTDDRLNASRALMVSGTLNAKPTIETIRALGGAAPAPLQQCRRNMPRAVIAASEQARAAKADLIVTVGGADHLRGQGGAALPRQRYKRRRRHRKIRARGGVPPARIHRRCGRSACRPRSPAASFPRSPASPTRRRK